MQITVLPLSHFHFVIDLMLLFAIGVAFGLLIGQYREKERLKKFLEVIPPGNLTQTSGGGFHLTAGEVLIFWCPRCDQEVDRPPCPKCGGGVSAKRIEVAR